MISIHTPHAGSDFLRLQSHRYRRQISIHTPHAGSDNRRTNSKSKIANFNPHSPCGERPGCWLSVTTPRLFQSTLPMRGATYDFTWFDRSQSISIHTPHAGSDKFALISSGVIAHFNPHSPCGERHKLRYHLRDSFDFNPHSPCGERQLCFQLCIVSFPISIHTPHAGSDEKSHCKLSQGLYFNPHSPCGERHDCTGCKLRN